MNAPAPLRVIGGAEVAARHAENEDRRGFLGSSDAAAIVGVSPWKTRLDVYLQKRGEAEPERELDPQLQEWFAMGTEEEPVIISRLIRRYGVKVTKRSVPEARNRYIDPEHNFLRAEIDFEWEVTPEIARLVSGKHPEIAELITSLVGTTQNGEAKRVHHFQVAQFGEDGTEDVPIQYAGQASHGLMVTGRQLCMFAVKCGDDLLVYWIKRDPEIITPLRSKLVAFWNDHVLAGVPPEPVNLPDVLQMFKRAEAPIIIEADGIEVNPREVFPDGSFDGDAVPLKQVHEELELAKAAEKAAAGRIEDLKFVLGKAMLGEDKIARAQKPRGGLEAPKPTAIATTQKHMLKFKGAPLLTIALEQQTRLDTDAVRTKHPEVAAECSKTNRFFKFREPTKSEKLLAR